MAFYLYGKTEIDHLCQRDPILGAAIGEIGHIQRPVEPDLFVALIGSIIAQQISTKAAATIMKRLNEAVGRLTPQTLHEAGAEAIQKCGITIRKAGYIAEVSRRVMDGDIVLEQLREMPDAEVCACLASIDGIGVWTAEMLMTFSMQRPDVISWGDLAIQRGLRMLYRHRRITKKLFAKYQRRYSPHATVASLYLWAIAGGAHPTLQKDPAPEARAREKAKARKKPAVQ